MATKEISVPFAELSRLEVYCACGTAVLLDIAQTDQNYIGECPTCKKELSDKLKSALTAYKRFFSEAADIKAKILFRVVAE